MSGRTGVWKRDRWVKPFFRQYRRALVLALFLGVLTLAFAAALMFTSGYLIGGSAEMPYSILLLNLPLMFVRIFGVGKPVLQYFERLTSHNWVLRMTSALRLKLYGALEREALDPCGGRRLGDVLGLLAEDIGHIQNLYLRTVFPTVVAWLLALLVVIGLGTLTPWVGLAMLLVLGVDVALVPLVSVLCNGARELRRKELKNRLYADLTDNVMGVADWVFSGRSDDYLARHAKTQRELRELEAAGHRFDRRRDLAVQALFAIGAVIVLCGAALRFGQPGAVGGLANWILAFALGYFPLLDAFAPLPVAAVEARAHEDSIARLNELSAEAGEEAVARVKAVAGSEAAPGKDASQDAGEARSADSRPSASAAERAPEPAAPNRPAPQSPFDLRIENVEFAYPGSEKLVLNGLALFVRQGEHVAILGRSGSGKSTLTSLVRGDLRPTSGRVTLGGVPTADLGEDAARYFGVIQQRTYLFNATLRENLLIGNPDATDEELTGVLARVGLGGLLARLPEGLDTLVDEAGLRFSGGERHRIALARVLLQDAPVVILDEPTVGLDPVTERAVLDTLFDALADRTLLMVTHHLSGVARMDRAVFLEDGRLKWDGEGPMDGSPAYLEAHSPHYRRLLAFDRGSALS